MSPTRARTVRLMAALAAVALQPGGPGAGPSADHCPHHEPPHVVLAVTGAADAPVATGAQHRSHGPCTCVGECCSSAAPSLVAPGPARSAVLPRSVAAATGAPRAVTPRPERPPHFPSYPNPPPTAG